MLQKQLGIMHMFDNMSRRCDIKRRIWPIVIKTTKIYVQTIFNSRSYRIRIRLQPRDVPARILRAPEENSISTTNVKKPSRGTGKMPIEVIQLLPDWRRQ
ncbi:hypothetical protein GCM10011408_12110 [Dyella caseinilytica]|nr:hypothetical protein GCM10011408_12110 [Dyella caseinilytica]